jgi:gluconokinase
MIVVVTGVAGAGKSTVGRALAARLDAQFVDADEFHSPESLAKMQAGIPLDDADREPWLAGIRRAIERWSADGLNHVLACSALKMRYRDRLKRGDENVQFVFLRGSFALIEERLRERPGHFFAPRLLESQFAALEAPTDQEALCIDAVLPPEIIVERVVTALALDGGEY